MLALMLSSPQADAPTIIARHDNRQRAGSKCFFMMNPPFDFQYYITLENENAVDLEKTDRIIRA